MHLHGRTAVVTGAASGIGLAMARRFVAEGMQVVLADVSPDRVDAIRQQLENEGARILAVPTDVSDPASVDALADAVQKTLGDVHLLCNNAGIIRAGSSWAQDLDSWRAVLDVNLGGVVHGLRSFVPRMLAHGQECHVVNTASVGGLLPAPGLASYSASKAAVVGLTETLAAELDDLGAGRMGVSALCPGGVSTGFWASERERHDRSGEPTVDPVARARFDTASRDDRDDQTTPEQIAELVVRAVRQRIFWIVPVQPELGPHLARRFAAIEAARARDSAAAYRTSAP